MANSQCLQAPESAVPNSAEKRPAPEPGRAESPDPPRVLTPQAQRALAEAEERRRQADARKAASPRPKELGGAEGPDPTRYGDWEKNGIASDF